MTSQGNTLEKRETMSLVDSDKVEGTPVCRPGRAKRRGARAGTQ